MAHTPLTLAKPQRSIRRRNTKPAAARLPFLAGCAVATAVCWPTQAHASIAYAYMLATAFDFGGGCQTCHSTDAGGLGTVTKPFGKTLMRYGLKANDTYSLEQAVTQLSTSDEDSDGDAISDFDELAPDGDPNDPTVFPVGATAVPSVTSTAPASSTPPASSTTIDPSPAPQPSGAPTTAAPSPSTDAKGCSLAPANVSRTPAALLTLLGLGLVLRRRR